MRLFSAVAFVSYAAMVGYVFTSSTPGLTRTGTDTLSGLAWAGAAFGLVAAQWKYRRRPGRHRRAPKAAQAETAPLPTDGSGAAGTSPTAFGQTPGGTEHSGMRRLNGARGNCVALRPKCATVSASTSPEVLARGYFTLRMDATPRADPLSGGFTTS